MSEELETVASAPAEAQPTTETTNSFSIPDSYSSKEYLKGVDSYDKVFAMLDEAKTFSVPEEYKQEASLNNIKNVNDLFKGYVNAQKLVGKKGIEAPADIKDYEISADDSILGMFKEAGVSKEQAAKLVEGYNKVFESKKEVYDINYFKQSLLDNLSKDTKELDEVHGLVINAIPADKLAMIPNDIKLDIYKFVSKIKSDYAIKGTLSPMNNTGMPVGDTYSSLTHDFAETLRKLDNSNSSEEKAELRKKLNEISAKRLNLRG